MNKNNQSYHCTRWHVFYDDEHVVILLLYLSYFEINVTFTLLMLSAHANASKSAAENSHQQMHQWLSKNHSAQTFWENHNSSSQFIQKPEQIEY